ncbi:MAG: hypothetical protein SF069_18705 [Phycisphaerae bacterium]|nr:hypothetical protein [Phycisphaerae bacterium]
MRMHTASPLHAALDWWLRRNPAYLLSAAAMTYAATLVLRQPDAPPGRLPLIFQILAALTVYELAILAAVVGLHRAGRSPEDQPALRLLAALFWTAPLAATLELTLADAVLGRSFTLLTAGIAAAQLIVGPRALATGFGPGATAAGLIVLLVVAGTPIAISPSFCPRGLDDLRLYAAWWGLGLAGTIGAAGIAWRCRSDKPTGDVRVHPASIEGGFVALLVAIGATHLYGIDHAFFCNAEAHHLAPALGGLSLLAIEVMRACRAPNNVVRQVVGVLTGISLLCSIGWFHAETPMAGWGRPWNQPIGYALAWLVVTWGHAAWRMRDFAYLHGLVALSLVALCWQNGPVRDWLRAAQQEQHRAAPAVVVFWLYGTVAYLALLAIVRRNRPCGGAAVVVHFLALAAAICGRIPSAGAVMALVAGWHWLAFAECIRLTPLLLSRALGIAALTIAALALEMRPDCRPLSRSVMIGSAIVWLAIGLANPRTGYHLIGGIAGGLWATTLSGRAIWSQPQLRGLSAILAAFGLLAIGVLTSWNKSRWLPKRTE